MLHELSTACSIHVQGVWKCLKNKVGQKNRPTESSGNPTNEQISASTTREG